MEALPLSSYGSLIETYGTHYITQVHLGGKIKALTSIKTCLATINGLSPAEVSDCLTAEASDSLVSDSSIRALYKHCQQKQKPLHLDQVFSSMFHDRVTKVTGVKIDGANLLFTR